MVVISTGANAGGTQGREAERRGSGGAVAGGGICLESLPRGDRRGGEPGTGGVMEPKQAKAAEADQFSSLPEVLQDDILVRLDLRDAVRTSVLCRAWGNLWKSMSVISLSFPAGTQPSAVDSVLLAYIGPRVSHFGIYVEDASADRVDDWLVTLSHRPRVESVDMVGRLGSGYFKLHSSIFSFDGLVSLRLRYCDIPRLPVGFTGFPTLQTLVLNAVEFPYNQGDDLEAIIRRSPLLSALELSDVLNVDCLIEAPNLRSLILDLDPSVDHAWRIGELPCLEDADIKVALDPPHEPSYGDFLARFAHVQRLTLFVPVEVYDVDIPPTLPFSFYNLKDLKLSVDFTERDPVLFMFTLLRSCHNLQNLEIELRGGVGQSFEADWEFLNAQWTDGMCAKLQVVRMIHTAWLPNEISFMKLMLSKSRLLRTLYVGGHPGYFNFSLADDLLKCERASDQVFVLFEGLAQQY